MTPRLFFQARQDDLMFRMSVPLARPRFDEVSPAAHRRPSSVDPQQIVNQLSIHFWCLKNCFVDVRIPRSGSRHKSATKWRRTNYAHQRRSHAHHSQFPYICEQTKAKQKEPFRQNTREGATALTLRNRAYIVVIVPSCFGRTAFVLHSLSTSEIRTHQ